MKPSLGAIVLPTLSYFRDERACIDSSLWDGAN